MYQKGPGGACLGEKELLWRVGSGNVNIKPSRRTAAASSGLCSLSSVGEPCVIVGVRTLFQRRAEGERMLPAIHRASSVPH